MVLNMLTTIAMIRVGKTYGNLMVDVQTGSEKLKDRARRIVAIVTGVEPEEAGELLKRAKWNVKAAIVMKKAGVTLPQALRKLKQAHDSSGSAGRGSGADTATPARGERNLAARPPSRFAHGGQAPAAARSSTTAHVDASESSDAGTRVVTGPPIRATDDRRLRGPVARSTTVLAVRIVAIPMECASRGTSRSRPSNR
jgi:hypothetical protein